MNLKYPFRLLSSIIPALVMLSCGESDMPEPVPADRDNAAYMALAVVTNELPDDISRADYTFEGPANDYEKIQTMRFIIVDKDGNVEHNVSINQEPAVSTRSRLFKVKPNETKTVYLIGNEASIPSSVLSQFTGLKKGEKFPTDYSSVTLSRAKGQPLYADGQLIPMTEFHTVEIGDPRYDGDTPVPYKSIMFVTRTAIKVSFTMEVSDNYRDFSADLISTVSLNQIADLEYLFPNNTSYDPAKSPVNGNPRAVTTFTTPNPDAANTAPYTFTWKIDSENPRKFSTDTVYLPEILLLHNNKFTITLPVNGVSITTTLPNIPDIIVPGETEQRQGMARNTHVKVNITLNGSTLDCTVDVVPYAGIDLNPDFGFDKPWIRPPYTDGQRPPWADLT